jgi:hypothetical protein
MFLGLPCLEPEKEKPQAGRRRKCFFGFPISNIIGALEEFVKGRGKNRKDFPVFLEKDLETFHKKTCFLKVYLL